METKASQTREDPKPTNGEHDAATTSRQGTVGQWERFEVKLSKPSGKQRLGMVLKHAQIVGEERVKRGAYLAGLAEGPSVAQDLGLEPKDRLISVEGEDVKSLGFDRIVALIRKATFPLTLVWSRQRRRNAPSKLPGTAVTNQRTHRNLVSESTRSTTSSIIPTTCATAAPAKSSPSFSNGTLIAQAAGPDEPVQVGSMASGKTQAQRQPTWRQAEVAFVSPSGASTHAVNGSASGTSSVAKRSRAEINDGNAVESGSSSVTRSAAPGDDRPSNGSNASIIAGSVLLQERGITSGECGNPVIASESSFALSGQPPRRIGEAGRESKWNGNHSDEKNMSNNININGDESYTSLSDVAEEWTRVTQKARVASRLEREAETSESGGDGDGSQTGLRIPGIPTNAMNQQAEALRRHQQQQLRQQHNANSAQQGIMEGPVSDPILQQQHQQRQQQPHSLHSQSGQFQPLQHQQYSPHSQQGDSRQFQLQQPRRPDQFQQQQQQQQLAFQAHGVGGGMDHMAGGRISNAAAQAAVAEVLAHQVGVPGVTPMGNPASMGGGVVAPTGRNSPAWHQRPIAPAPMGNVDGAMGDASGAMTGFGATGGGMGGSGANGGSEDALWRAREVLAEKERKAEASKQRRRERDKQRREERRREEMAMDAGARLFQERPDGSVGIAGDHSLTANNAMNNGGGNNSAMNNLNNSNFAAGSGGSRTKFPGQSRSQGSARRKSGQSRSGSTSKDKATADGGGLSAGSPEWLTPLMRAGLRDFIGTRYARSRLKQTLSHEWAQQEYRTGIALRQVDRTMTEMEYMRRRMAGGSLYALLEQEAKDYLRQGAYTDSELEQLGTNFARMALAARATQKSPTLGITNGNRGNATPEGSIDSNINSSFYRNNEGRTWADHLRSFQIDVPDAGLEALSSERERIAASQKLGVGGRADGASTGGGDDSSLGSGMQGVSGGLGSDTNGTGSSGGDSGPVWDGQGVEASTVIQHRRRFDVRCTAYEALNNSTKNDKTTALVDRTHRLHREHLTIIAAKRGTLEGTLENVRSQLSVREGQLRRLRDEKRGLNPLDPTASASLAESEAALKTRIAEKKYQMMMIMDEAAKVVEWERTADLARREALLYASDVHGHGGASAADAAQERGALVDAMMSQKATIMLLSTFCKLRGPWLAPPNYTRKPPQIQASGNINSSATNGTSLSDNGTSNNPIDAGGNHRDIPPPTEQGGDGRSRSSSPFAFSSSLASSVLPNTGGSMSGDSLLPSPSEGGTGGQRNTVGASRQGVGGAGSMGCAGGGDVASPAGSGRSGAGAENSNTIIGRGAGRAIDATRLGLKLGGKLPQQRQQSSLSAAILATGLPSPTSSSSSAPVPTPTHLAATGSPLAAVSSSNIPGSPSTSPVNSGGNVGSPGKLKRPIKLRMLPPSAERRRSKLSPMASAAQLSPFSMAHSSMRQEGIGEDGILQGDSISASVAERQDTSLRSRSRSSSRSKPSARSPPLAPIARGGKEAVMARLAEANRTAAAAAAAAAVAAATENTQSPHMSPTLSSPVQGDESRVSDVTIDMDGVHASDGVVSVAGDRMSHIGGVNEHGGTMMLNGDDDGHDNGTDIMTAAEGSAVATSPEDDALAREALGLDSAVHDDEQMALERGDMILHGEGALRIGHDGGIEAAHDRLLPPTSTWMHTGT